MGGCSVLVLLGALLAMGAAFLIAFLGALGLFLVAVILTIVFAVRTPRRRAAGKKLGALIAIPIVLYAVSIPVLAFSLTQVIVPFAVDYTTANYNDACEAVRHDNPDELARCLTATTFAFDDAQGDTPENLLALAFEYRSARCVGPLLDELDELGHPIDVNAPLDRTDISGEAYRSQYPLLWVCEEGNAELEAVQALIERGADINIQDEDTGWTPLMWACAGAFEGYWDSYDGDEAACLAQTEDAIDQLLAWGADPSPASAEGDTALSIFEAYVADLQLTDLPEDDALEAISTYRDRLAS